MAGVTNAIAEFETPDNPGFSSEIQAVINQFGASNLLKFAADFDPETRPALLRPGTPAAAFIFGPATGLSLADNPGTVAAADPTKSLLLHTALLEHGAESTRYVLTGAKHGDLSAMLGDPDAALAWCTEEILGYITDFLAKHLYS